MFSLSVVMRGLVPVMTTYSLFKDVDGTQVELARLAHK
jgi:hypothetical protein